MVGHTHEDIDALFGNISKWLKRNDAFIIPGKLRLHVEFIHVRDSYI